MTGTKPGEPVLLSLQRLYSTGKPDGSPFNKTADADGAGATTYTVDGLQSGGYEFEVSPDGGSTWSKNKVTVSVR
jgi:hypothetical protein